MSNEIMQENTPFVECSAFHRGMSVLEASLRNTEDSEAIISGLLKGTAEFYGASRAAVVEADWDLGIGVITYEWCKDVCRRKGICSSACPWRSSQDGGKHFGPINRS